MHTVYLFVVLYIIDIIGGPWGGGAGASCFVTCYLLQVISDY